MSKPWENELAMKLQERTSLLMRVYWQDDLLKIGKELGLPYISSIGSWFDLNHYQGALEIARNIDDSKLTEILSSHPKPYGIDLGGFQGRFYTLNETGALSFESSQDTVRKNVNLALRKWGEKAYGVLQALVNKNGRSAYFELIDEIGKVLGREFVPSYLLPRLSPTKLVFKTGSNKYPDWTVPTEIIPIVKEELLKFHANAGKNQSIKQGSEKVVQTEEDELFSIERKLDILVESLVDRKREINMICQNRIKTKFFRDNEKAIMSIKKPCSNEEDFDSRILGLSSVIDDVEIDDIRRKLKMPEVKKSIELIELLLGEKQIEQTDLTRNLKMLKLLRNKKYPAHFDDGKFLEATKHFGQPKFPPDWEILWENVLKAVVESLTILRDSLQSSAIGF